MPLFGFCPRRENLQGQPYLTVYKNQTYSKDNWEDLEGCQGRQKNQKTSVSGLYLLFASLFLHCCACELTAARYSTAQKTKRPQKQDASLRPHAEKSEREKEKWSDGATGIMRYIYCFIRCEETHSFR
ncbi:MAG: hypothetical protein ACOCYO_06835 [Bacteroidota bacterium]